ncbi:hypothetical protein [Frigoribacterium sp. PhB24]|uniref:hypothetical protein n=1 Tax=Frigoribacterium sp. PhB24 TaxID=2485204 RepID=UPI000F92CAE3|nr:hypothetical protein [Frigoribacterium sp. PhB24]ROS51674.1 hypothetical protein EDF50_1995 [Frigoribacterium sp. PhB24]
MRRLYTSCPFQGLTGAALIAASGALFLGVRLLYVYKGATYKCAVEGPHLERSQIETQLVSGSFSAWPIARECTYVTGSVVETTRGTDDTWLLTGFLYAPALLGLLLLVIAIVRTVRSSRALAI